MKINFFFQMPKFTFQEFEIQKMSEKNKLLESNTVKYIEPCTASNLPMNRASLLSAMNQWVHNSLNYFIKTI